ncbi:sigma-70 family RNA polymerase sigma factor [Thalassoglobus neptunius]|nr:sigma-70 family RNA polymerase sigma factor [Thalassoglobus neptunius]
MSSSPVAPSEAMIGPDEFVQLVMQHQGRIVGYLVSLLPDRSDVDDLFQEVTTFMWEKRSEFERGTNFGAWACRIAYFKVQEFRRKEHNRRVFFSDELVQLLAEDAAAMGNEFEVQSTALQECLEKLPSQQRDLVLYRFRPDVKLKDVVKMLNRSEVTVRRRLQIIIRNLGTCITSKLA